jgi:hypothetical protein
MKMSATRGERVCLAGLLILIIGAAPAAAQTPGTAGISFGVLGGVTQARLTLPLQTPLSPLLLGTGITVEDHRRTCVSGGVFIDAPVFARVGFETGAMVSVKGTGIDVSIGGVGTQSAAIRLVYFDVPILARAQVWRWSAGRAYFLTGPTIETNLDAKLTAAGGASENLDGFPRMDYAWTAAGRIESHRLLFEVRYDHGLRNLTGVDASTADAKNRAMHVLAGIRF